MSVLIYHNPRCSKSRQTLALLEDLNQDIEIVEYLKTPPSMSELKDILGMLKMAPRELMRNKEAVYSEQELDNAALSDDELIKAMIAYPILIERPIVLANGRAKIGRPPECVKEIL